MSKFWMIGAAAIEISAAVMAWYWRPVRPAEDLLVKAQSEFAIKARDALIQRRMAQAPIAPVATAEASSVPALPEKVAATEPVAPPTRAAAETPDVAIAPAAQTASVEEREVPLASPKPAAPAEAVATPAAEKIETAELQMASVPALPVVENTVTSSPAPAPSVAPAPEAEVLTPVIVPEKAAHKTERSPNQPATNTMIRGSGRDASKHAMPHSIQALRARAAAAFARYM